MKPFLNWAGGKYKLVERIKALFPETNSGRFIEPFLGAGAVALNMDCPRISVNDNNGDLINTWLSLRLETAEVIRQCGYLFEFNEAGAYYQFRKEFNERKDSKGSMARRAALFIYLNKHGFNGLCRYNLKNEFNVPFGKYKTVSLKIDELRAIAAKTQNWEFSSQDFRVSLGTAQTGDIVYCDPPYVTDEQVENGFTAYTKDAFGINEQTALAYNAYLATRRGATVIISNHDTKFTRQLYQDNGATLTEFDVQRNISCDGANRKKAREILACFSPVKTAS